MEDREKIRRAYFVDKKSQRQIARELACSRDSVKKEIESAEFGQYALTRPRPAPVLGPHKPRIDELLEENEHLPREQRYIGHTIYKDIYAKGYRGSESTVRGYIAQRRGEKRRPQVCIPRTHRRISFNNQNPDWEGRTRFSRLRPDYEPVIKKCNHYPFPCLRTMQHFGL